MLSIVNSGCAKKSTTNTQIEIKIDTLSEQGKATIEKNLMTENGVSFVKAHLRKKVVTIVYDTTLKTKASLESKLQALGYKVNK